nr:MAG TPA: hypothetical protein [Caudoviricetes sp.]
MKVTVKTTKHDPYAPPYRWRQKLKAWMRLQQWKHIQKAMQRAQEGTTNERSD